MPKKIAPIHVRSKCAPRRERRQRRSVRRGILEILWKNKNNVTSQTDRVGDRRGRPEKPPGHETALRHLTRFRHRKSRLEICLGAQGTFRPNGREFHR